MAFNGNSFPGFPAGPIPPGLMGPDFMVHFNYGLMCQKKQEGEQALNDNQLETSLVCYSEALNLAVHTPGLADEIPKLMSNRSLVLYKMGQYQEALSDAVTCVNEFPKWIKGYWRAMQASKAMKMYDQALAMLGTGYLQASGKSHLEDDQVLFMTEIINMLLQMPKTAYRHVHEHHVIHTIPVPTNKILEKVLQRLSSTNCWEGVSLLMLGRHSGLLTHFNRCAHHCACQTLSVGALLMETPNNQMKNWGVQLAILMLNNGAFYQEIEEKLKKPAIHVGLKIALDFGNIDLLKQMFTDYITSQDRKDAVDEQGNTAYHVLVHSGKVSGTLGETLLRLLLNRGCRETLKDKKGKQAKDYLKSTDQAYCILESAAKAAGEETRKHVNKLKEDGNLSYKNKDYAEAIRFYTEALDLVRGVENREKEEAMLLSNRSAAFQAVGDFTKAYQDSQWCVNLDKSWHKGHWRRAQVLRLSKAHVAAFSAFLDGFLYGTTATPKDRVNFLVEAMVSFQDIEDLDDVKYQYTGVKSAPLEIWPGVLGKLSKTGDWKAIGYLVFGYTLIPLRTASSGDITAAGVAATVSLHEVSFSSLFDYIQKNKAYRQAINKWLTPLVQFLLNKKDISDFREDENDTPLHALARYCVIAGEMSLLEGFQPIDIRRLGFTNSRMDSVLHMLYKMKPKPATTDLTRVTSHLLMLGCPVDVLDVESRLPIFYVSPQSQASLHQVLQKAFAKTPIDTSKPPPVVQGNKPGTPTGAPVAPSAVKALKDAGNTEYQAGNYPGALDLYTEAVASCQQIVQYPGKGHDLAVLYGNRAECYLKLGQADKAFDDAIESVSNDGHWYKGHLRVAKSNAALGDHETAVGAFVNAFNGLDKGTADAVKLDILQEMCLSVCKSLKFTDKNPPRLESLTGVTSALWARVSHGLVAKDEWEGASFAYLQFKLNNPVVVPMSTVNLKTFCNLRNLRSFSWCLDLVQYFLVCGCDHTTISVQKGDRYFHAVVRMCLVAGVVDLLIYLLSENVKPNGEENLTDDHGNTVLHIAAREPHIKAAWRVQITAILIEADVDTIQRNKDGRLALEYVPEAEAQTRGLLIQAMAAQNAVEKDIKRQWKKQSTQQQQEERQKQQEQLQRQKQQEQLQKQQKQQEIERKQRLEREKEQERKKKQQQQARNKIKEAVDVLTREKDEGVCRSCETNLSDAKQFLAHGETRRAYQTIATIFRTKHKSRKHDVIQNEALTLLLKDLGETLNPEIPEKLAKIPNKIYERIVEGLAEKEKWRQMDIAVKEFRTFHGKLALNDFAKKLSVAKVIRHPSLQGAEVLLLQIVENMLESGAVLQEDGKLAILNAVQEGQFKVLELLFNKYNADLAHLTIIPGDTPMHAAMSIALERDKGNFALLNLFFDKYEKDPEKYPMLDPNQQDAYGDGLFHMITRAKFNSITMKATEMLCNKKVNALLYNKDGKTPKDYLSKKGDRRTEFIRLASAEAAARLSQKKSRGKRVMRDMEAKQRAEEGERGIDSEDDLQQHGRPQEVPVASHEGSKRHDISVKPIIRREQIKNHIEKMIVGLPDIPYSILHPKPPKLEVSDRIKPVQEKRNKTDSEKDSRRKEEGETTDDSKSPEAAVTADGAEEDNSEVVGSDEEGDDENVKEEEKEGEFQFDPQIFDNLEWEVECTADVWKTLQDTHVLPELKRRVIHKVQLLARGEWRPHLCKKVTHDIPESLRLYEAKVSKGGRILWEVAIAFSPRLSETAERRLQQGEQVKDQAVRGGRIYSEIIRVWDIVFDHDKIYRSVQKIVKSHSRGEQCIIQKKLKGIKQDQFQAGVKRRIPMIFAESETEMDEKELQEYQQELQPFYPPASSNDTEYHILKFYSFSSNLVSHVLQNLEMKVDFPFRVTDLEHAIINLQSRAPLLLLGRSGTGKTTCCLYRLWSQFLSYWTRAIPADAKLLPRGVIFREEEEKQEEEEVEEEEGAEDDGNDKQEVMTDNGDDDIEEILKDEEDLEGAGQQYDHLQQVFITKNAVLCSEVQKNFRELSHACDVAKEHVAMETQNLPHRLQEVNEFQYPLFITSKQLLLMLDASLDPPYFFDRNEDGSLKVDVQGWTNDDGPLSYLPLLNEDSDDEEEDDAEGLEDAEDIQDEEQENQRRRQKVDPRREVTYEVFAEEVWPKICKKYHGKYHPSLIWTEIMSFIKGSFEALKKPEGYLKKGEYLELGKKRAPNFTAEREHIYKIFQSYDHFKRQRFMFDETDLVRDVHNRLKKERELKWTIHQIYVDETQDFTQAELCLLLRICQNPNQMFLTGDTAQSIMRGIAFRFSDLRSLFFYARKSMRAVSKSGAIEVPKQVYQLTHNYRSHAGILFLASSILDLMVEFFPESFDRLQKDQGLFHGPAPVLLESCSFSDLAMLLRGHKRKTSRIEFGAHQAILVVNEAARDNIPEELHLGLILTIYEAKGLEFDDILLYNFFKDSQAAKEWRVVTDFLEKLADRKEKKDKPKKASESTQHSLVELNHDILNRPGRPRPLTFDQNHHKVLNSELKHLYTAVTRARVNVWIFDEDMEKRAPMFEYFKARKLVRGVRSLDDEGGSSEEMFAEESTPAEWIRRGEDFMKHSLYEVAAKCFSRGGDWYMADVAHAHQLALLAFRVKDNPTRMREEYLNAAAKFLECELPSKAVLCLQKSREKELTAFLYEKLGQLQKAAETYRKLNQPMHSSRCYEQLGMFNMAITTLFENELYDMAIDTLTRYKILKEKLEKERKEVPRVLIENAPSIKHSEENLSYKSAELYHRTKNLERMMTALRRLPKLEDRTNFLIKTNYIKEAASLLLENDRLEDAADLYLTRGMTKEAIECARQSDKKFLHGRCLLIDAMVSSYDYLHGRQSANFNMDEVCRTLDQVFFSFQDHSNKDEAGEAYLLRGQLTGKIEYINKTFGAFTVASPYKSEVGMLECMHWMVHNSDLNDGKNMNKVIIGMDNLFSVLKVLVCQENQSEKTRLERILMFYGFKGDEDPSNLIFYPQMKPRALDILKEPVKGRDREEHEQRVGRVEAITSICQFLIGRGLEWKRCISEALWKQHDRHSQCPDYQLGRKCRRTGAEDRKTEEDRLNNSSEEGSQENSGSSDDENQQDECPHLHENYTYDMLNSLIDIDMLLIEMDAKVQEGVDNVRKHASRDMQRDLELLKFIPDDSTKFRSCDALLQDMMPSHCHLSVLSSTPPRAKDLKFYFRKKRNNIKQFLTRYLRKEYDIMRKEEPQASTKVFVKLRFLFQLMDLQLGDQDPKSVMLTFENEILSDLEKKYTDVNQVRYEIQKKGFLADVHFDEKEGKKKVYQECIARRFYDAYDYLSYVNCDPTEALIKFTKFVVMLGDRNKTKLLPGYSQFFFWLEYFTTVGLTLSAKVKRESSFFFVVPESFISAVYLVDASYVHKQGVSLFEAVQRYNSVGISNLFQDRLRRIIAVLCGHDIKMNLIRHLFKTNGGEMKEKHYGVAERILVLSMVFLCNMGKSVLPDTETSLIKELCKIQVTDDFPPRMAKAVTSIKSAGGLSDIASALQCLLQERQSEDLYFCRWDSRSRYGLTHNRLKSTTLMNEFYDEKSREVILSPYNSTDIGGSSRGDRTQMQEEDLQITEEERLKKRHQEEEHDLKDRENRAAIVITNMFKRKVLLIRCGILKSLVEEELLREKQTRQMQIFQSVVVDDTGCGICGKRFEERKGDDPEMESSRQEEKGASIAMGTVEFDKATGLNATEFPPPVSNLSPEQLRGNPFADLLQGFTIPNSVNETKQYQLSQDKAETPVYYSMSAREEHEDSSEHRRNLDNFQMFKRLYKTEIWENHETVSEFIDKYKLGTSQAKEIYSSVSYHVEQILRMRSEVSAEVKRIIDEKDWLNSGSLTQTCREMFGIYNQIMKEVEGKAKGIKQRANEMKKEPSPKLSASNYSVPEEEDWEDDLEEVVGVVEEPKLRRKVPKQQRKAKGKK